MMSQIHQSDINKSVANRWNRRKPKKVLKSLETILPEDEFKFLLTVNNNPYCKLNDGEAFDRNGDEMWTRLERLGLIECVGSYKWKITDKVKLGIE